LAIRDKSLTWLRSCLRRSCFSSEAPRDVPLPFRRLRSSVWIRVIALLTPVKAAAATAFAGVRGCSSPKFFTLIKALSPNSNVSFMI
jgi:hypothetical protein